MTDSAALDFERPILSLEKKLKDLRELSASQGMDLSNEIDSLEIKLRQLIDDTFAKLTPWQRVQLSRHPNRPHSRDYFDQLFPGWMEVHGDRCFSDDPAIVCGIATWPSADGRGESLMILGHQKGRTTKQKVEQNFGMAKPEGYRKAIRLFELAHRLRLPILTLVDTPGAFPGIDAEERGQSQAIAECLRTLSRITVPVVTVVIGEGGSGGALALAIADRVWMQEYSVYSVISPESCASILWSNASLAEQASDKLKLTSRDLFNFGVIDGIVEEPKGGAHRNWPEAIQLLRDTIQKEFNALKKVKNPEKLLADRLEKFRKIGQFSLAQTPSTQEGASP